ncbi:MAG TPA: hypothetical protein DCS09_04700 [Porphyromonadaceae bacterium]|nr:hypothetical protein [Porphyromonadaceae bacterium]
MEVVYSEKDQALIDKCKKDISDFDEQLVAYMRHTGFNPEQIYRELQTNTTRKALIDEFSKIIATRIPVYFVQSPYKPNTNPL